MPGTTSRQIRNFGMPGVFAHEKFRYLEPRLPDVSRRAAQTGSARLYETFSNDWSGYGKARSYADEYSRDVVPGEPAVCNSALVQRDNNEYEEQPLLSTLSYFAHDTRHFLPELLFKEQTIYTQRPQAPVRPLMSLLPTEKASNRRVRLLKVLRRTASKLTGSVDPITVNATAPRVHHAKE